MILTDEEKDILVPIETISVVIIMDPMATNIANLGILPINLMVVFEGKE